MLFNIARILCLIFGLIIIFEGNLALNLGFGVLVPWPVDPDWWEFCCLFFLLFAQKLPRHTLKIARIILTWRNLQQIIVFWGKLLWWIEVFRICSLAHICRRSYLFYTSWLCWLSLVIISWENIMDLLPFFLDAYGRYSPVAIHRLLFYLKLHILAV